MSSFRTRTSFPFKKYIVPVQKPQYVEYKKCDYCALDIEKADNMCNNCKLIQKNCPLNLVIEYDRRKEKKLSKILTITYDESLHNWQYFEKTTLNRLIDYTCIKYIGINGKKRDQVSNIVGEIFQNDLLIDDRSLNITDIQKKKDAETCIKNILDKRNKLPRAIGVSLSHIGAWQYLKNTKVGDEKYALILEDLALVEPYGLQNIEIVLNHIENIQLDVDILYIGHSQLSGTQITPLLLKPPNNIINPVEDINCGLFGYIINLDSINNLINAVKFFEYTKVDHTIQKHFGELIDAYFVIPDLITLSQEKIQNFKEINPNAYKNSLIKITR
jgi:GR25 family glycosyltransferase involved in LPS biosynthesis